MLTIAVQALGRADTLVPALRDLGRRHAYYGVQPAHYDTVEVALLWTLEHTLGDAYTRDVKQSWTTVLALVSSTMKDAARPSRTARQC